MIDTSQNDAKGRSRRRILFWLGWMTFLVVAVVLMLCWSGQSGWEKYKRQWEAKGERFDFKSFVPQPVPDDQNFARAPIVASCYAGYLDKNGHAIAISPPNTNVVDRLSMELSAPCHWLDWPTNGSGDWRKAAKADLQVRQQYYRALAARTNDFPVAPQPQSPAVDVLLALSKYDSAIEELRRASRLPCSRFPLNYDNDRCFMILLPHLAALKHCSQVLQLRAIAELQNDQSDRALADVKLLFRLTDSIRSEPLLISHLVRIAMVNITLQPVWEGVAEHRWSDAQLRELNQELAGLDFLADYEFAIRGERAASIKEIDHLRRHRDFREFFGTASDLPLNPNHPPNPGEQIAGVAFHLIPGSVFYQNELNLARIHQQWLLPIVNVERRMVSPETARQAETAIEEEKKHFSPNKILAFLLAPPLEASAKKFAFAQSSIDLARIGCALERYRLAQGGYPESLDSLSPQFMEKIPHDIINGQPLQYRRPDGPPAQGFGAASGKFLLYSVGWNGTNDDGQVSFRSNGTLDITQGDWVWPGAAERSE
jgi:hypothetical protein